MTKVTNTVMYSWRGGGTKEAPAAQAIGERLAFIERKKGTLQAEFVVNDAQSSKSPLHRYFDWDDSVAARKWRLEQAQNIIRHIYVKQIGNREIRKPTRAFVNYREEGETTSQYENILSVMSDDTKRKRLLLKAKQELADWRSRYDDLTEFADLFPVVDRLLAA